MLEITLDSIPLEKFDIGGVLYHANYFHLYEQAREAFLEHVGIPYSDLVQKSKHFAVVESHQEFLEAIRYGEEIELSMWAEDLKKASVTFCYEMHRDEELIHRGWTKHAFVSIEGDEINISAFPKKLREALESLYGE